MISQFTKMIYSISKLKYVSPLTTTAANGNQNSAVKIKIQAENLSKLSLQEESNANLKIKLALKTRELLKYLKKNHHQLTETNVLKAIEKLFLLQKINREENLEDEFTEYLQSDVVQSKI